MADISVRQHIRWPPAPPSEPTSTVVLTSPGRHFVDVRVLCSGLREEDGEVNQKLDWAFAGTSSSQPGREPGIRHAVWRHWVDSHTTEPETVRDEAVVNETGGPGGSELETGRMVNPATGVEAEYEEAWSSLEPLVIEPGSERRPAYVVLRTRDDEQSVRGMLIRLGQFCQGVLRDRDAVTVERWQWDQQGGWTLSARFGETRLPVDALLGNIQTLKLNDVVEDGTKTWKVIEVDGGR